MHKFVKNYITWCFILPFCHCSFRFENHNSSLYDAATSLFHGRLSFIKSVSLTKLVNKEASRLYAELLASRADDMHASGRCADDIWRLPVKSHPKSHSCVFCTSSARSPHEISTPKIFPVKQQSNSSAKNEKKHDTDIVKMYVGAQNNYQHSWRCFSVALRFKTYIDVLPSEEESSGKFISFRNSKHKETFQYSQTIFISFQLVLRALILMTHSFVDRVGNFSSFLSFENNLQNLLVSFQVLPK